MHLLYIVGPVVGVGLVVLVVVLIKRGSLDFRNDYYKLTDAQRKDKLVKFAAQGDYVKMKRCLRACSPKLIKELGQANYFVLASIVARIGALDCLKLVVSYGADPNYHDSKGDTPLMYAARNGHLACVKYLVECGVEINKLGSGNFSALMWASLNGREDVVKYLLSKGADLHLTDDRRVTCVHYCSVSSHPETLKVLIDHGAAVDLEDIEGDTPLHYAAKQSSRCVSLLLNHGARVDAANKKGQTPLDLAVQHGHPLFVHKLLLHSPAQSRDKMLLHCIDLLLEAAQTHVQDKIRHVIVALCVKSFNANEDEPRDKNESEKEESFMNEIMGQLCKQFITHGRGLLLEENVTLADDQIRKFRVLMHTLVNIGVTLKTNRELLSHSSENIAAIRVNNNNTSQEEVDNTIDETTRSLKWSLYQEHVVTLDPLWRTVSRTLHATHVTPSNTNIVRNNNDDPADEVKSDLNAVRHAAVIIEAFSELSKLHDSIEKQFVTFIAQCRDSIKHIVDENPFLLMTSFDFILENLQKKEWATSFGSLVHHLAFEQKKTWLKMKIEQGKQYKTYNNIDISVTRGNILQDTCGAISTMDTEQLKGKVWIKFNNEEGVGAGVVREWFRLVTEEMFNPDNALFTLSVEGNRMQPNSLSDINPDHLSYFRMIGRVLGLAITNDELINVHFTRGVYKHVLDIKPNLDDLYSVDATYHKNLKWILENDIGDMDLDLTFSVEENNFGARNVVELVPNGLNIAVTELNKDDYVQLMVEYLLTKGIHEQLECLTEGLYEVIPRRYLRVFNEHELELLIAGLPNLDLSDWRAHTVYTGGYSTESPQITWLWRYIEESSFTERTLLLQFVTGSAQTPVGGFAALKGHDGPLKFTVLKTAYQPGCLPTAATCFNLLKLPEYPSYEELKDRIQLATSHGSSGFAFA